MIAGNGGDGVRIDGAGTDSNVVQNNDIETQDTDPALANANEGVFVGSATGNNFVGINGEQAMSPVAQELVELVDFLESQGVESADPVFSAEGISSSGQVLFSDESSFDAANEVSESNDAPNTSGQGSGNESLQSPETSVFLASVGTNVDQPAMPDECELVDDDGTNPMLIVQDASTSTQQARSLNTASSNKARSESENESEKPTNAGE